MPSTTSTAVFAALQEAERAEILDPTIQVDVTSCVVATQPATMFTVSADGTTIDAACNLVVVDQDNIDNVSLEIQTLASSFDADSVAGMGTLDLYGGLLDKIFLLQNLSRSLQVIGMDNLDLLASRASDIGDILSSITRNMAYSSTIDDTPMLSSVRAFLARINAMVTAVQRFHVQINATAIVKVPRSIETTAAALTRSKTELLRVQGFLNSFTGVQVLTDQSDVSKATMSASRARDIQRAVQALDTVKALGDATLSGSVQSVQNLIGVANEVSNINFDDSLKALQRFATSYSLSGSPPATVLTITSSSPSLKLGQASATITFSFNKDCDLSFGAITCDNGTLDPDSFVVVTRMRTYTALFTAPSGDTGSSTIRVGTFTDAVGNTGLPAFIVVNYDTQTPTVSSIIFSATTIRPGNSTLITFHLSENSPDFSAVGLIVQGGELNNRGGSDKMYTATFTAYSNVTQGSVTVPANSFHDSAGNLNPTDTSQTVTINSTPILTITPYASDIVNIGRTATIFFTFDIDFTLTAGNLTCNIGTLSNFSTVNSRTYSTVYRPPTNSAGSSEIGVTNITILNSTSPSTSVNFDTIAPYVRSILFDRDPAPAGVPIRVTFTLSKPSIDFVNTVPYTTGITGGSLSTIITTSGEGTIYTANFTGSAISEIFGFPKGGTLNVRPSTFTDTSGNRNTESFSKAVTIYNPPTLSITSDLYSLAKGQQTLLTFSLLSGVFGSQCTYNGTVHFNGGYVTGRKFIAYDGEYTTVYAALFTPPYDATGSVTVSVDPSDYYDDSGHAGVSSSSVSIAYNTKVTVANASWHETLPYATEHTGGLITLTGTTSPRRVCAASFVNSAPFYSDDGGCTWIRASVPTNFVLQNGAQMVFNNTAILFVGYNAPIYISVNNGTSYTYWATYASGGANGYLSKVLWVKVSTTYSFYVAKLNSCATATIAISSDGKVWTKQTGTTREARGLVWAKDRIFTCGLSGCMYSFNGTNWVNGSVITGLNCEYAPEIGPNGQLLVTSASSASTVHISADLGISFTQLVNIGASTVPFRSFRWCSDIGCYFLAQNGGTGASGTIRTYSWDGIAPTFTAGATYPVQNGCEVYDCSYIPGWKRFFANKNGSLTSGMIGGNLPPFASMTYVRTSLHTADVIITLSEPSDTFSSTSVETNFAFNNFISADSSGKNYVLSFAYSFWPYSGGFPVTTTVKALSFKNAAGDWNVFPTTLTFLSQV